MKMVSIDLWSKGEICSWPHQFSEVEKIFLLRLDLVLRLVKRQLPQLRRCPWILKMTTRMTAATNSPEFETGRDYSLPLGRRYRYTDVEDSDSKLVPPGEEVFGEVAEGDDQEACKQTVDGTRSDRKPDEGEVLNPPPTYNLDH